jgi:hypothetical protein
MNFTVSARASIASCDASRVSILGALYSPFFLVLFRQKNRSGRERSVGDDSKFVARVGMIGGEKRITVLQAALVFLAVLFAQVSPVATHMAGEKFGRLASPFARRRVRRAW